MGGALVLTHAYRIFTAVRTVVTRYFSYGAKTAWNQSGAFWRINASHLRVLTTSRANIIVLVQLKKKSGPSRRHTSYIPRSCKPRDTARVYSSFDSHRGNACSRNKTTRPVLLPHLFRPGHKAKVAHGVCLLHTVLIVVSGPDIVPVE